jgi:hypothetical protein
MREEDVVKIRQAIAQMTPSQLEQWLQQTRKLREYVESDEWQQTKQWLRGFLRVQNIYSDKEIEQLRKDILNADAEQMLEILREIQEKHDNLVRMHQASEKGRQLQVQQRNQSVARQEAAMRAARSSTSRSVPLFGSTAGSSAGRKKSSGYRVPGPLITSRQVARGVVRREVLGGRIW